MKNNKPVWLLDIDGVINAVTTKLPNIHPEESWHQDKIMGNGYPWPITWSEVVRDFLVEMSEHAEIVWHTTWQHDAQNIADVLGLPKFAVVDAPEFQVRHAMNYSWWKMGAALRVINEYQRPLIWTDDDLSSSEIRVFQQNALDHRVESVLFITPSTNTGLSPRNLETIRAFLEEETDDDSTTIELGAV